MKRYIKQKVFSWGDKFSIFDEFQNEIHYVEGEPISLGKKLHLYGSKYDDEECYIHQKAFSLLPRYFIDIPDKPEIEVLKEFKLFKQEYTVDPIGWKIEGDFFAHTYEITHHGELVAAVAKQWLAWGDTYEIEIIHDEDEIAVLALILVIDAVLQDSASAAASASTN